MGSKWVLVLFMFVSLEGCLSQISGCWDEERVALLQLQHFFNGLNNYWVEGERNSDCCQWKRVECNNSTGRVIRLNLNEARGLREVSLFNGLNYWVEGERNSDCYLNASLFSAFEQLEELDLWGNSIAGFVDNGGLDKLSRLRNLESLDLSFNMFNNDIFSSLNALPSLTSLDLSGNGLNETVDLQGLDSSKNLKFLSLYDNRIEKVVFPKGLDKLSRLRNLEYLDLTFNMFNNDILSSINVLPSLTSLYLDGNRLNETVDLQGLYSSKNLMDLDLSNNQIEKVVFPKGLDKLSRLRNLEYLGLGRNMFNNDIFSSLNALPSLTSLYLYGNRLNETVDLQVLHSYKNLKDLDLSFNQIEKVVFPKGLGLWLLQFTSLDSCKNLKNLSLDFNQIEKVVFPKGLDKLSRLRNLEYLNLGDNMFNNDIFSSLNALPSLKYLYLYGNWFNETVDLQGLDKLSRLRNLEMLDLGGNMFNNDIFSSLNALPSLKSLDLSFNSLNETVDLQGLYSSKNLTELYLSNNQIEKVVFPKGFKNLVYLDLSYNQIEKVVIPKGSDKLLRLSNLENLYLQYNRFNNNIFSSLGALSSLNTLYLNDNGLKGVVNVSGLDSLYNLEFLNMSNNEIGKLIFPKGLRGLTELHLQNVSIHDGSSLLQSLVSIPSLATLDLSYNNFSEMTTTQEYLHNFTFIEELRLDGSSLHISLLQSIVVVTSPRELRMKNCQVNGVLGSQEYLNNFTNVEWLNLDGSSLHISLLQFIGALTSLDTLSMRSCQLNGILDFQDLPNFKNLKYLSMDYTSLDLGFLQRIGLMTSLEALSLVNCGLQGTLLLEDGGVIPKFLYHQQHLEFLDLSNNNLTGGFPNWLLENNTELQHLFLANNLLGGYLSIHSHMNLTTLDISSNSFQGHIPKEVGEYLPSLETLNLSRNHFDGSIPSSIGDMTSLQSLDLSYNSLFGEIPEHLAEGCTSLSVLVLSNNKLGGKIFSAKFNLTNLMALQLNGNSFTGSIPDSLSKASYLAGLYLGDNKLSGRIPSWLGNMLSMLHIIMPNNHFEGPIPLEFCQLQYLEVLNLAENNLSSSLPPCFSPLSIKHVHLSKNKLQGQLKDAFFNSSSLVTLDLGYNRFDGSIPTWIGRLSQLTYLILSNNNLEGEVPTQLCQLNQLRLIDLSHNNLSGYIPPCLDFTALHEVASPFGSGIPESCSVQDHGGGQLRAVNSTCPPVFEMNRIEESVEFTTKTNLYSYQGKVLTYMSGVDISCNKLTGPIPPQVGNLTRIHALNLSHNNLTGPIPLTFSKLKEIESLDLSYNNLNGKIPPQLVELYTLSSFNVAHNNLSGRTPERIAQFNTFDENSYEGNPLLCGPPLHKSCETTRQPSPMPGASTDKEEDNDLIDMDIFYMSFTGSYTIVFLGIAAVLYINPYWRRTWFYLAETWMTSCYYFIVDNLPHRFCH